MSKIERVCSTCKHEPRDEHCKGCKGEKDGNTHCELEELYFSTPKKVVGKLISIGVLDKIRSEIIQMPTISLNANDIYKTDVLSVIDKYRKEQE